MNKLNYASLEASKRLVDAGIVLETEVVWYKFPDTDWKLGRIGEEIDKYAKHVPAPSMAEALRELPDSIDDTFEDQMADTYELMIGKTGGIAYAGYFAHEQFENTNPTDALIDLLIWLLIWVRKEGT